MSCQTLFSRRKAILRAISRYRDEMISKARLKELAAYRLQKRCDDEEVFVVEGPKMCAEAMASGFVIRTVCATTAWLQDHAAKVAGIEVQEVSQTDLERMSNMKSPNQVWMLVKRKKVKASDDGDAPTLALDCIQDPGNMGTMLRTADWYGIRRVVCSADTVSCYNPKVVQASMGAIFRTKVEYTSLPQWLATCQRPVYGATLVGKSLHEVEMPHGGAVLLIGNESRGISAEAMAHVTHPVLIPNRGGTAESLNASVAAGILMDRLWNN